MTYGRILLVDDDHNFRRSLSLLLKAVGFNVLEAIDGKEAVEKLIKNRDFDLIITDLRMERMDGLELLKFVIMNFPHIPLILITAYGTVGSAVEAMKLGAVDYIEKPFEFDDLEEKIKQAIEYRKSRGMYRTKEGNILEFVGSGPWADKLKDIIRKFANSDIPILITGETGTGKSYLAEVIHKNSNRKDKPFVVANCASIPEGLCEVEFLGYTKGSFTGASSEKEGLIKSAERGTLFLDEIGDMPLNMQVKLLDVLERKKVRKVGSLKEVEVDVRFIAATNQDINKALEEGKLRRDLYYRLSAVHIHIPPLRERKEDIPKFLNYFLEKFKVKYSKDYIRGYHPAVWEHLLFHDYPGNVRELSNIIAYAVLHCDKEFISFDDLPEYILPSAGKVLQPSDRKTMISLSEKSLIIQALRDSYTLQEASKKLNMSRITLWRKLRVYGIEPEGLLKRRDNN
jgi:DNA-binding NtrC family response regulator